MSMCTPEAVDLVEHPEPRLRPSSMGHLGRLAVATAFFAILSLVVLRNHPDEPFLETVWAYVYMPLRGGVLPGIVLAWGPLILTLVVPNYFTIAGFFVFVLPIWLLLAGAFIGMSTT